MSISSTNSSGPWLEQIDARWVGAEANLIEYTEFEHPLP
jgi:hypothetical protein